MLRWGDLKEVFCIKYMRKMQQKVESKIRHAMATGVLPVIQRNSHSGQQAKEEPDKSAGTDNGQGK